MTEFTINIRVKTKHKTPMSKLENAVYNFCNTSFLFILFTKRSLLSLSSTEKHRSRNYSEVHINMMEMEREQ